MNRIVITGPESTGKTELARSLAERFGYDWIPEYARLYVEHLKRPYNFDDVIQIARHQIEQEKAYESNFRNSTLIFDTWLIITKVWFDLVFGRCPEWVVDHIHSAKIDLFLVCDIDLPWIPDSVRENGGEKRRQLLDLYCKEISSFGFKYEVVTGAGPQRIENALRLLSLHSLKL